MTYLSSPEFFNQQRSVKRRAKLSICPIHCENPYQKLTLCVQRRSSTFLKLSHGRSFARQDPCRLLTPVTSDNAFLPPNARHVMSKPQGHHATRRKKRMLALFHKNDCRFEKKCTRWSHHILAIQESILVPLLSPI